MAKLIVDTNVAVVANQRDTQANLACISASVQQLNGFFADSVILVLDQQWHILKEYQCNLYATGQPGVGDKFLKWVLTNQANPRRCERVPITLKSVREDDTEFVEFPDDPRLDGLDRSDRKFVAVACAHPDKPPIVNAVDNEDWSDFTAVLTEYQVDVRFLCF